nr:hypothetical protein [Tanacetum cinerariifolium]
MFLQRSLQENSLLVYKSETLLVCLCQRIRHQLSLKRAKVPDELKVKSTDTSEGTGVKPRVLDVLNADTSYSENESWRDSREDDDSDDVSDDDDGNDDDSDNDYGD